MDRYIGVVTCPKCGERGFLYEKTVIIVDHKRRYGRLNWKRHRCVIPQHMRIKLSGIVKKLDHKEYGRH